MDCKQFFEQIKGKRIAVCGIGISNTPLILNFLNNGAIVTACDRRSREALGELAEKIEMQAESYSSATDISKILMLI